MRIAATVLLLLALVTLAIGADNATVPPSSSATASTRRPVGWRGDGSGLYLSASPVIHWSATENVRWKAEVGTGQSSPIVIDQRVFVTAEPDLLICLDAETGKELWRKAHRLSELPAAVNAKDRVQLSAYGDTTPTPVSDGKRVWCFIGTGIVACYDLDGKTRWINWYDLRQNTMYGRTASPVLIRDRLLVHFGPLACLDAATGKLLWQNDNTRASYGTPVPARIGEVDVVITPKGHVVRVADGKTLASDLGNCTYTSPVVQGRMVYFIESTMTAVQLPEQAAEVVECKELWSGELTGDVFASPLVHGERLYTVGKESNYLVIDTRTGKTIRQQKLQWAWAERADGARAEAPNVYPSLCLAGNYLFASNDAGDTLILQPGDPGAVVGTNSLPRGSGATPTFSGRRMFIRGGNLLYCIGGQ